MPTTTKLHLKKPEGSDDAKIADINDNMDTIDAAMPIIVYSSNEPTGTIIEGTIWLKPVASEG
ncbi:MAG: hypothetical protein J6Z46_01325 [Lachnospiraceae bacterium]|nr:hypothetical protein [Lachnospiraceae bacterium]